MKRNIGVLLLMMFLLIITSCGQMTQGQMDGFDGVIYNYEEDLTIGNIIYEVYLPENFKDNIFYSFDKFSLESKSENWVINQNHEVVYWSDQDFEYTVEFYDYINTLTSKLDNEGLSYNIYKDEEAIELEFVIDNPNKELIGYGLLTAYIPIKLINNRRVTVILVPIMFDVLKLKNDLVETISKDSYIPYEQFLENEKLIND